MPEAGITNLTDERLAIAKTVPAIAGAMIYGFTLQDWVAIATLLYVALQIGLLTPKYWRLFFDRKKDQRSGGAEVPNVRDQRN